MSCPETCCTYASSYAVSDLTTSSIGKSEGEDLYEAGTALSRSEAAARLRSLTPVQKTALVKIARLYAQRTAYDWEDLLQEAYGRILAGDRSWRRDLPAVPFFGGVMKSIAWEWKRNEGSTLDDIDVSDEGAEARGAIARQDVKRVLALFNDDPIARKMVTEMMMGTKGKDLREACGLTQTAYESKRKKIRRHLEKIQRS